MVVFVVLHYKVFEETKTCVSSLLNLDGEKKIIIVDNCSPNNSGHQLKELYSNNPDINVIINEKNLGFAQGNNIGYSLAKQLYDPEYIVVMNNDMEICNRSFIAGIKKCFNEYFFDIMGPDVYSTKTKSHQNPRSDHQYNIRHLKRIRRMTRLKLNLRFLLKVKSLIIKKKPSQEDSRFVDSVELNVPLHGSFYVFSKKFIQSYDECFYNKTFMYMEAEILYHRAMRSGLKMVYYPNLQVLHHEDVATNSQYNNQYKKAVFTLKCLLSSCNAYIELLEEEQKQ